MAITINGSGTITGVSAGGLPDGSVTADDLASTLDLGSKTLTIPTNTTGLPSGGLEEVDVWKLTSSFSGSANPISSNVSRATSNFEKIGTGMSFSSGTFTFPSTGKWKVSWTVWIYASGGNSERAHGCNMNVSTDGGSTYSAHAGLTQSFHNSGDNTNQTTSSQAILDVTDISNVKVQFQAFGTNSSVYVRGDSGQVSTHFMFQKLGDT